MLNFGGYIFNLVTERLSSGNGCRGRGEVEDFLGRPLLMGGIVLVLSRWLCDTVYGEIEY